MLRLLQSPARAMPRVLGLPAASVANGGAADGDMALGGVASARTRLVRLGGLALALGLLILGAGGAIMLRRDAVAETQADLRRLAVIFAEQTARAIQSADQGLLAIIDEIAHAGVSDQDSLFRLFQTPAQHAALIRHTEHLPQLEAYTIVAADGRPVNASRIWPMPDVNMADRSYFQHFLRHGATEVFVSEPVRNRLNGEHTIYMARPIIDPEAGLLGVVNVALRLGYFDEVFGAAQLTEGSGVILARDDGTILSRTPYEPGTLGRRIAHPDWHAAARAGGAPYRLDGLAPDGRGSRFGHVAKVAGYPLLISMSRLDSAALARWRGQALAIGAVVLLGALLVLLLATLQVRHSGAIAAHARDIAASEAALARTSAVLRVTLENIAQGIIMVDGAGRVAIANRRAAELLGLPAELLAEGSSFAALARHQRAAGEFDSLGENERAVIDRDDVPNHQLVYERRRPDGTVIEVQSLPLSGGGMVRTYTDITARAEAEAMLALAASHDHLTGLVNRNGFSQRLERLLQASCRGPGRFALLCLDLDGFKSVNDSWGHEVGDALLQKVGERMRQTLREGDLLARMGGDEFAILLDGQDGRAAGLVAQRLLEAVGQPYQIGAHKVLVGVSIGIVTWPLDGNTSEELLRRADGALYEAKTAGRNRWCAYASGVGDREHHRLALERDMREALAQQQFSLAYQPICDAQSGQPVGFEALLRWQHPTRGAVSPGEFIPVAELSGLIVPLGRWALEAACAEAASWAMPARIAVNVSPAQFRDPGFLADLRLALARSGLPGNRLEIEMTEGLLLEETEDVVGLMRALRALGVRMVLDDFGTANSNLSYLRGLPFDAVKIDRSFLRALSSDRQARALVTAILAMAHALELEVVGEGVETPEQLAMLRHLHCDLVQGYLLGKPETGAAAREWLWRLAGRQRGDVARQPAAGQGLG